MTTNHREESIALFEQVNTLFNGKNLVVILGVIVNLLQNCIHNSSPSQRQAIIMTVLESLGIEEVNDDSETLQ